MCFECMLICERICLFLSSSDMCLFLGIIICKHIILFVCCSVSVIKLYFSLSFVYYGFVPDRLARLKSWKAKKLLLVLKKKIE